MSSSCFFSLFVLAGLLLMLYLIRNNMSSARQQQQFNEQRFLSAETMPTLELSLDETDQWEMLAINLLRDNRELSAVELVQNNTGLDFEEARVKLYKLEDADEAS